MRKNVFENLAAAIPQAGGETPTAIQPIRPLAGKDRKPPRISSPLGAITESLGAITEKAQRAEEIEKRLAEGQAIVELDPGDIDGSFVRDRMIYSPEDHSKLIESIRSSGQQVPILVRPHPEQPGRYQVAYGHRRLRAVAELGLRVKAVIRDLSNEQLVVAQGQENNERTNLSFIEKARFAGRLEEAGFSRDIIMQALCVDKALLSKMISVIRGIPADIIDGIGHAPSVGLRRWQELASLIEKTNRDKVRKALSATEVQALESDKRYEIAYKVLTTKEIATPATDQWVSADGVRVAKYTQAERKFSLVIDEKSAPEFGQFLIEKMQGLYEEFKRTKQG